MIGPFVDGGFEVQSNVTLVAGEVVPPPKMNREIVIRRIEAEGEWDAVLSAKISQRDARLRRWL